MEQMDNFRLDMDKKNNFYIIAEQRDIFNRFQHLHDRYLCANIISTDDKFLQIVPWQLCNFMW